MSYAGVVTFHADLLKKWIKEECVRGHGVLRFQLSGPNFQAYMGSGWNWTWPAYYGCKHCLEISESFTGDNGF